MKRDENAVIVEKCLREKGLEFQKVTDKDDDIVFWGDMTGLDGHEKVRVIVMVNGDRIASYTSFPSAEKSSIEETAKFLSGVNMSLPFGFFVVDWNDGKIFFRLTYSACVLQTDDARECVTRLVNLPYAMYYKHSKAITAVRLGLATAEEAVRLEEAGKGNSNTHS